jgi:FAD/FMN-containing dehydrogenase/Fe-S oxidoreductase
MITENVNDFEGELYFDNTYRTIYSTDASPYKERPLAVAFPKSVKDIQFLIGYAKEHKTSLIPRGAGTSLAGQVTGNGIVVDVSKYMNSILNLDVEAKKVTVQPGIILTELNQFLEQHGLFFGPETSTANRCTLGGMSGNNACGLHSLIYGSTRDHTESVKTVLSDGSEVLFAPLNETEFQEKLGLSNLEGSIYQHINKVLSDADMIKEIDQQYPEKEIPRRNTGYALDLLSECSIFREGSENTFNFSKLLSGSEGTLGFITELTLNLVDLPPKQKALAVVHFESLEDALHANLIALNYNPGAVELMDKAILELSKKSKGLEKNREIIKGEPGAVLMIEFARDTKEKIQTLVKEMEDEMKAAGYGYHFPLVWGNDIKKVWELRKAGLGVLSNVPGDGRPVSLVEDTAVNVKKLPDYISEFKGLLKKYDLDCVYHAHIGSGELHIRPIINLKDPEGVETFKSLATDTAHLVKKYKGSLSGEHGDGRLRGEFIPLMLGEKIYQTFKEIKDTWDPECIFNPGKIINTASMNDHLRYVPGEKTKDVETVFDFSDVGGYLRGAEKCNGSGDCIKPVSAGGTMCPTYMASKDEKLSTRARANMLREVITNDTNPFSNKELYDILDLCISCKACKSECPSNVDVAKLKAEFLQHHYDAKGAPLRSKLIAHFTKINSLLSIFPYVGNFFLKKNIFSGPMMKMIGFSEKRNMPTLSGRTLKKVYRQKLKDNQKDSSRTVYLFADEFTNYNESDIGIKAIQLLNKLGYNVLIPTISESGRTYLSKGFVRKAKKLAAKNIQLLENSIAKETPLLGIEPSTILSFRDEYPDLFKNGDVYKEKAIQLSKNCLMIDEFLAKEIEAGRINEDSFTDTAKHIKYHGHCQQKAVASTEATKAILSLPKNFTLEEIPSGCCGMAGSFGYEKEHYDLSMKIGETVLFPEVRKTSDDVIIAASGTSCRHQIKDGTDRTSYHPIEILWEALA